jgi:uncharacterized protein YecE (DUF72 family)
MIRIGTSGYSYSHWQEIFYPEDVKQSKWLEFYGQHFNTVELNVTFYRLPQEAAFKGWYRRTPRDFLFVVKGSRFITHVKKLKECEEPLGLLFSRCKLFREKLGAILWQLPPSLKADTKKLENFLEQIKIQTQNSDSKLRLAFEFRHQSWFTKEIYDLLKKYNVALCIADSPKWPLSEEVTADFIYLRFHGGKELYGSNYSDNELKKWAEKIKKWRKAGLDIYCYFNNDAYGYAVSNAKKLRELLSV